MRMLAVVAVLGVLLGGCTQSPYYGSTTGYPAASCSNTPGILGGLGGAGAGALLGNQFGKGTGKGVATGLGALAGGAGGYYAGNNYAGC